MKFAEPKPYADPEVAMKKLLEIANSVEAVQDGRIDLIASTFTRTPDRERQVAFSVDVFNSPQVMIVDKASGLSSIKQMKGLTFGVFMFQHKGLATIKGKDGETRGAPYFNGEPVTMPMAEMFKIKNGKIRDVEAIGIRLPYGMGSGWE